MDALSPGHGVPESEALAHRATSDAVPRQSDTGMYEAIPLSPTSMALRRQNDSYEDMSCDLPETALFVLGKDNLLRKACIYVVKNIWFTRAVLLAILLNCVTLAASSNSPAFAETGRRKFLDKAEYFFVAFFALEMVLNIISMGFILERGTYMRNPWNIMDFLVVVLGIVSLSPAAGNYMAIRAVRVLRPLRTITRVEGMKNLVITLLGSLPMLLDVLVLCFFALFIYGIIGVQLMKGVLQYRCADADASVEELKDMANRGDIDEFCSGLKLNETAFAEAEAVGDTYNFNYDTGSFMRGLGNQCDMHPDRDPGGQLCRKTTVNPNYGITHFDHFPAALLTVFQCVTLEGWTDIMYALQDALTPWIWIYFVTLVWVGSFFAVQLALAVLYSQFKQSQEVSVDDAKFQQRDATAHGKRQENSDYVAGLVPVAHGPGWWRWCKMFCFRLQAHRYFDALTTVIIIINTAIMMVERHLQPPSEKKAMDIINYGLTAYFALEVIIKIIGLGWKRYIADMMNVFDGLVVIVSLFETGLAVSAGNVDNGLSILRTFRLLRIFKLARSWKELNKIINTIFQSLSSIAYLSLILLLMMFIFALLGMQLFGYTYYYCDSHPGSFKLCPENDAGTSMFNLCPSHFDCYITCSAEQAGTWINVELGSSSQYFNLAFCEEKNFPWDKEHAPQTFPEIPSSSIGNSTHYVAMVGGSDLARHNFDDIAMSFITIFQILTGENWNTVMYDGMRSTGRMAFAYFVLLVVVGNYIILNLFLAILLDNFGSGGDDPVEPGGGTSSAMGAGELNRTNSNGGDSNPPVFSTEEGMDADDPANIIRAGNTNRSLRLRSGQGQSNTSLMRHRELRHRSLFIFGAGNPLRLYLNKIVSHKYFEYAILALIMSSSITLALDSQTLANDVEAGKAHAIRMKEALAVLDKIFVALFVLEAVLKIIVMGFVLHPDAYLRNPWNILDFFIVIISLVLLALEAQELQSDSVPSLRALRTFRALRPIRMASQAEGMKIVINALFQSIPPLGNVALVCVLFFLIFGILFVNLLKGSFYSCRIACPEADLGASYCSGGDWLSAYAGTRIDPQYLMGGPDISLRDLNKTWCLANSNRTKSGIGFHYVGKLEDGGSGRDPLCPNPLDCVVSSTYHWNERVGGNVTNVTFNATALIDHKLLPLVDGRPVVYHEWVNKEVNFDNVLNSLITLFEMSTTEMYLDVMYDAMDSTSIDQQPIRDNKTWICFIVVLFLVVCSFFILKLFVGVTIDKFNDMKAKQEGRSLFLTEEQQNWLTIQKLLAATKPKRKLKPPEGGVRRMIYNVVTGDWFDGFIMAMIMINVLFMAMEHHEMSNVWIQATGNANLVFTGVFTSEAILKVLSMGFVGYFRDPWNTFDFTVLTVSIVTIGMEYANEADVSAVSLLRVFRVARIFRLIPKAKGLRTLFQTLMFSLAALLNVGSVLVLFFFIFSIMGMNLFGNIRENEFLTRHANFQDFPRSMLVLMRMATGESWNGIMHDCAVSTMCVRVLKEVKLHNFNQSTPAGSYLDPVQAAYYCEGCYAEDVEISPGFLVTPEPFVVPDPSQDPPSAQKLRGAIYSHYFKNECGQPMAVAAVYFLSFVLMCSFILLNLVIAVILDNFQSISANEAMPVSRFHMSRFVEAWADLDSMGTCFIPVSKLSHLISELEPPLGVKGVVHTKSEVQNIIMTVDIPNRAGHVHFLETLHALSGRVAGTQLPEDEELLIHKQMHERLPDTAYPKYSAAHYHAALYVQAAVRGFLARHQMKNRLHSVPTGKGF